MIEVIIGFTISFTIANLVLRSAWFQKWRLLRKLRKCDISNFAHVNRDGHAYGYDTVPGRVYYDCKRPVRCFGYYPALVGRIFKK